MTGSSRYSDLLELLAEREGHDPSNELVRRAVQLRASNASEYCLRPTTNKFHVDHIIPTLHWAAYVSGRFANLSVGTARRGPHHLENYAWICPYCNQAKGSTLSGRIGHDHFRLFDPRRDIWHEHFEFVHGYLMITGISPIGYVTERALRFNDARIGGPLGTRHELIMSNTFPPPWARDWLAGRGHP